MLHKQRTTMKKRFALGLGPILSQSMMIMTIAFLFAKFDVKKLKKRNDYIPSLTSYHWEYVSQSPTYLGSLTLLLLGSADPLLRRVPQALLAKAQQLLGGSALLAQGS